MAEQREEIDEPDAKHLDNADVGGEDAAGGAPEPEGGEPFVPEDLGEEPTPRPKRGRLRLGGATTRMRGAIVLAALVLVAAIVAAFLVSSPQSATTTGSGTAEATVGSIRATVQLTGVVVQESTQSVPAPVTGEVTAIDARPGDAVAVGDTIMTVTVPTVSPSPTFFGSSPSPIATPSGINENVTAPIAGTIGKLSVTKGQTVVAGQQVVTVIPSRYDVIANVPQNELYRFYTAPLSVQVSIPHQDQPVDCTFLSVGGNVPSSQAAQALATEPDFRCQLPDGTAVFPGVQVKVIAVTAEVDDAITLPTSAVLRNGNSGTVWLVEKGHPATKKEVTVGIVGGGRIQIVSGLFAGQQVLDPAPSPTPTP
ncbi:MAG TPA: HlyD family efflux transporter periplasmic adaptor subunit [Actinomycetota bacterium]|nr:HlyD family efflux transporter periplasmic adaptor subunit [Actinomycetota bacterium]